MTETTIADVKRRLLSYHLESDTNFDDALREYRHLSMRQTALPGDCLLLIVEIFSSPSLFKKAGMDQFIVETYSDRARISPDQFAAIINAIRHNYTAYDNLDFCWVTADFVARSYPPEVALDVFQDVFPQATQNGREGVALGLEILRRDATPGSDLDQAIKALLNTSASRQ